jgi:hypothetical protein
MEAGERSILATLAYYDALRWPLTASELTERMIPSARLGAPGFRPDLGTVFSLTERMAGAGTIRAESGFYALGDHGHDSTSRRAQRSLISAQKWRRMLRAAWWLQAVPFVRMLGAGGSLALGSGGDGSDWDVFAVVQARRLYTARLGLLTAAALLGRLRTKSMRTAPDHFCFNHLITTDGLSVRHRSLYTAHALAWVVPFHDPWGYWPRIRQANHWLTEYVTVAGDESFERRSLHASRMLGACRRAAEFILGTFVGDAVEYVVRRWMQRRIEATPATHERGGRIVADDRELEFHPRSFEAVALARYNTTLKRLGLGQYTERDSGLIP